MPTYFGITTHRIIYKAASFATGKTVTAYIWNPTLVKSEVQTFTEIADGLYYLDYAFAAAGTYCGIFYEGGVATVSASFIINATLDVDVISISGSTDAADKLEASAETIVLGAAIVGTLSTTKMTTDLTEATNDHYNGRVIIWTSGVLLRQATNITDYDGASKMLTFTAVTEAPTAADTFVIV